MSAARDRLLREWFEAACDLPDSEWAGFLQGCEDVPLRAEVLDLLQRDRAPGAPLDDPLLPAAQHEALLALACDAPQPAHIGPYEVVRVIGRGSMGTVYEARAPGTGELVAIKVLRMGLPTRALLHRFRREAEILQRLEHPGIARILQSGTTQVGVATLPFIAMELVAGRPLDQYCDEEHLDVRARLDLLAQVGEAVQHAHGRGVVHRDLKPSNILVDAQGRPRLLDFGVARTTVGAGGPSSLHTATGQLMGTLQYMSPEQTLGDPSGVDARSDVYALGAVAYALLAGRPPYEVSGCSFDEALRRVRHEPPPPLDTLDRKLRGRVEVVLGRALEKESADRYPSAQAFVDDLRALRDGRPSAARAPSLLQQLRRAARRDPRAFRAAAILAAVLLLGIAGTTWGWLLADSRQRDVVHVLDQQRIATAAADAARAEAEEARAAAERSEAAMRAAWRESEAVVAFMEGMLRAAKPENLGSSILLVDALLLVAPRVDEGLADQPHLGARVHRTLATAFYDVGRRDRVLDHLDAADRLDPDPVMRLRTALLRAELAITEGRNAEAISMIEAICAAVPAGEVELRVRATRELARARGLSGDLAAGYAQLQGLLGPDGHVPGVAATTDEGVRLDFANLAVYRGETMVAEEMMRAVMQARSERLGPEHIETIEAADRLAELLTETGRIAEAEQLYDRCVEVLTRLLGPEHPHAIYERGRLARLLAENGRAPEVLPELEQLVAIARRVLGAEHPRTAGLLCTLGMAAFHSARPEALALCEEAVAVGRVALGNDHPHLVNPLSNLGAIHLSEGRMEAGIVVLREALDICERRGPVNVLDQLVVQINLCTGLLGLDRDAEARPLVEQALPRSRELQGDTHPQTLALITYLAMLCDDAGEWVQARALEEEALRVFARDSVPAIVMRAGLAKSLLGLGERAEGEALLRATLAEAEQLWGPEDETVVECRAVLEALPDVTPASSP